MSAQKILLVFPMLAMVLVMANAQGLKLGYYQYTCPDAEKIVQRVTEQYIKHVPNFAAGLLRMNFHDCIVRVCIASLLRSCALFGTIMSWSLCYCVQFNTHVSSYGPVDEKIYEVMFCVSLRST